MALDPPLRRLPWALLLAGCASAPPALAEDGRYFTEAQALRGKGTFEDVCVECHDTSEFRGGKFQFEWGGRSVGDLLELVSRDMPEDAPGTLDASDYADVVAYILMLNGFPPGRRELPSDPGVLRAHLLRAPPGAARARGRP